MIKSENGVQQHLGDTQEDNWHCYFRGVWMGG